jgi:hypothetical protein
MCQSKRVKSGRICGIHTRATLRLSIVQVCDEQKRETKQEPKKVGSKRSPYSTQTIRAEEQMVSAWLFRNRRNNLECCAERFCLVGNPSLGEISSHGRPVIPLPIYGTRIDVCKEKYLVRFMHLDFQVLDTLPSASRTLQYTILLGNSMLLSIRDCP